MFDKSYILENLDTFHLLSTSTNKVYQFQYENREYILKIRNLSKDNLSPFWQSLKDIFGSTFEKQTLQMDALVKHLNNNPYINVPKLISIDVAADYQVYEKAEGDSWEEDMFPDSSEIAYQLGNFIGYMHSINYQTCGIYPEMSIADIPSRMLDSMKSSIVRYWKDDQEVQVYFNRLAQEKLQVSGYSLIMTDISANQFLFSEDKKRITAIVDFDAYVVGPKEWELAVLEMCVADKASFYKGYELYQAIPVMNKSMKFYQFLMYLNNPWDKKEMYQFLSENKK